MARVVIITEPNLAPGFQMARVETIAARSAAEAQAQLEQLRSSDDVSVIAIHAPFLAEMDETLQRDIEMQVMPLVIALPTGTAQAAGYTRREQIAHMLRRAIGFQITFQPEETNES